VRARVRKVHQNQTDVNATQRRNATDVVLQTNTHPMATRRGGERGGGGGGRSHLNIETTPLASGFSTPVHSSLVNDSGGNAKSSSSQPYLLSELHKLAKAKEKESALSGHITKRTQTRSGGARIHKVSEKKIEQALTTNKRTPLSDRDSVQVIRKFETRKYSAAELIEASNFWLASGRSKKKVMEAYPNIPYQTILNYANNPDKYKLIDLTTNNIDNNNMKLSRAFERSLWCFIAMAEDNSIPTQSKLVFDIIRNALIATGATYYSRKDKARKKYDENSNVTEVWRGIHTRSMQDGFSLKFRCGHSISQDRLSAEGDKECVLECEKIVNWRLQSMAEEIYHDSNGSEMLSYPHVANIDEFKFPMCDFSACKFAVTGNKKLQAAAAFEHSPMITMLVMQVGTKAIAPGLIIIADPKVKEKDVITFAEGYNPENSAFRVMKTNNGWINEAAKLAWMKLVVASKDNDVGERPILLLADGHFTNHDTDFHEVCWQSKLFPYVWPGHLTHILQPMDARGGVITNLKKIIEMEVAKKSGEMLRNKTNLKELPKMVAEIATIAITEYNNNEKMRDEAKSALRTCGFFEVGQTRANEEWTQNKTTVPYLLRYAPSTVPQIQQAMHLDKKKKEALKTKRRGMADLDDDILKMTGNIIKNRAFSESNRVTQNRNGGESTINGGFDYTNRSTGASENAKRKKDNVKYTENERERIRTKKLRAPFERAVKEAAVKVTRCEKQLEKLKSREESMAHIHDAVLTEDIRNDILKDVGGKPLTPEPEGVSSEEMEEWNSSTFHLADYVEKMASVQQHPKRRPGTRSKTPTQLCEEAAVEASRNYGVLNTKDGLIAFSELLGVTVDKSSRKDDIDDFLFSGDGVPTWSQNSLVAWREANLGQAKKELDAAKEALETAQKSLDQNAPPQFEHALQKKPMLNEEEYRALDEREFTQAVAHRERLFLERERTNQENIADAGIFLENDASLEERANKFSRALLRQAQTFLGLTDSTNIPSMVPRQNLAPQFETEPDFEPGDDIPPHPYEDIARRYERIDERFAYNARQDRLRLSNDTQVWMAYEDEIPANDEIEQTNNESENNNGEEYD